MRNIDRFTPGAINQYSDLVEQGYYIRQEKFENTTVCSICRNINNDKTHRSVFGEVNKEMALLLQRKFGFQISEPVLCFGKGDPVPRFQIRYYTKANPIESLLD